MQWRLFICGLLINKKNLHQARWFSPGGDAQQEVGQLSDVFAVCAVAVEEVPLVDQFPQLSPSGTVVIS